MKKEHGTDAITKSPMAIPTMEIKDIMKSDNRIVVTRCSYQSYCIKENKRVKI